MSREHIGLETHPPYRVRVTCDGCWTSTAEYMLDGPGTQADGWAKWSSADRGGDYCPRCAEVFDRVAEALWLTEGLKRGDENASTYLDNMRKREAEKKGAAPEVTP